jgi:hypothetical protein
MQCNYKVRVRCFLATMVAVKNTKYFMFFCVFLTLGIQRAMLMDYIVIPGVLISP